MGSCYNSNARNMCFKSKFSDFLFSWKPDYRIPADTTHKYHRKDVNENQIGDGDLESIV